jgi:C1A family cysteine protease
MSDLHLDVHTGLPYLADDGNGVPRRMGRLLPAGPMALPQFKTYHAPIPQSEWREIDLLGTFAPPVLDQGQHGSCVGHGGCTAFTLMWLAQGEDLLKFSSCYLYGQINGGRDQGASIGDTIQALQSKGICLETTVPEGDIYASRFPASADKEAAQYKLIEAYQTSDPADVATAIQMGFAVADSVMVGRRFNSLDSDGMAGVDRGPGNHCCCLGGMKRLAKGWAYIHRNSWGTSWGMDGNFLTTDAHIEAQSQYEAVVFRAVSPGPNAPKLIG